nr:extracellular solute-binding protein, family 3 [Tanacetum cinerariifolium]
MMDMKRKYLGISAFDKSQPNRTLPQSLDVQSFLGFFIFMGIVTIAAIISSEIFLLYGNNKVGIEKEELKEHDTTSKEVSIKDCSWNDDDVETMSLVYRKYYGELVDVNGFVDVDYAKDHDYGVWHHSLRTLSYIDGMVDRWVKGSRGGDMLEWRSGYGISRLTNTEYWKSSMDTTYLWEASEEDDGVLEKLSLEPMFDANKGALNKGLRCESKD